MMIYAPRCSLMISLHTPPNRLTEAIVWNKYFEMFFLDFYWQLISPPYGLQKLKFYISLNIILG